MPTPPPIDPIADQEGGGAPNPAPSDVVGHQFHPASKSPNLNTPVHGSSSPDAPFDADWFPADPSPSTSLVAHLESSAPVVADEPMELRWSGAPTREAMRRLRREAWTPAFDAEQAFAVFRSVSEGRTVRQACSLPGMPARWEVVAWRAMVPVFEELMAAAETALGAEMRDRAVDAMTPSPDDPRATVDDRACAAFLKLAASFDRRIARGDEGSSSGSITVNLANFGSGSGG